MTWSDFHSVLPFVNSLLLTGVVYNVYDVQLPLNLGQIMAEVLEVKGSFIIPRVIGVLDCASEHDFKSGII